MDVKFLYHVVRLLNEAEQILMEGDLDLERNREQLKSIRKGEWTFDQIVKYFDKQTLEIFESDIERLTEIPGIAKKKLEMISQAWTEHKSIRDVMMFLQSHGISTLFAVRIYKEYGDNAIRYVTEDPLGGENTTSS